MWWKTERVWERVWERMFERRREYGRERVWRGDGDRENVGG